MSYNNKASFQQNKPYMAQNQQPAQSPSAFKLYQNFHIQTKPTENLCQKRAYDAVIEQETDHKLMKKVKNTNNSTSSASFALGETKLSFPTLDLSKNLAIDNPNLVESSLFQYQNLINPEPDTTCSPSEANSDAIHNPDLKEEPMFAPVEERAHYQQFFQKMHDNLAVGFQRQLEFLKVLKKMNGPEYAMYWPVLDKINPFMAGMLKEKSKVDVKAVVVMKSAHRLLKSDAGNVKQRGHNSVNEVMESQDLIEQLLEYIQFGKI